MGAEDVLLWELDRARDALASRGWRVCVVDAGGGAASGTPVGPAVKRVVRVRTQAGEVELVAAGFPPARDVT